MTPYIPMNENDKSNVFQRSLSGHKDVCAFPHIGVCVHIKCVLSSLKNGQKILVILSTYQE